MTEIKFKESFDGMYKRISKLMNLSVKFDLIPTTHFQNVQDLTLTLFYMYLQWKPEHYLKKRELTACFFAKTLRLFSSSSRILSTSAWALSWAILRIWLASFS